RATFIPIKDAQVNVQHYFSITKLIPHPKSKRCIGRNRLRPVRAVIPFHPISRKAIRPKRIETIPRRRKPNMDHFRFNGREPDEAFASRSSDGDHSSSAKAAAPNAPQKSPIVEFTTSTGAKPVSPT